MRALPLSVSTLVVVALTTLDVTATQAQELRVGRRQPVRGLDVRPGQRFTIADLPSAVTGTGALLRGSAGPGPGPGVSGGDGDDDGDGLKNSVELEGWDIVIDEHGYGVAGEGSLMTIRHVTSDPQSADGDGDGVPDHEEWIIGTDPLSADTDSDFLNDWDEWNKWFTNPNSVDSDGDARGPGQNLPPDPFMFDWVELDGATPRTSPTLADTDGDGRWDGDEVAHAFFSPLIAELPRAAIELDGPITVRLDVEYSESMGQATDYGTTTGSSSGGSHSVEEGSSHSHGFHVAFSSSITKKAETGGKFIPPTFGGDVGLELSFGVEAGTEHVWDFSTNVTSEQSWESTQEYSRYVSDSYEQTETAASGFLSAPIRLRNTGLFTYTLGNLSIAVLKRRLPSVQTTALEALGQGEFEAMATLLPPFDGLTLAPGEVTPVFQVTAQDVNADVIKEYLANPDSLVLAAAIFDMVSADGIDFDFITETTHTQTGLLEVNYGGGEAVAHRVATNVDREGFEFEGVLVTELLESVLGLERGTEPGPGVYTTEQVVVVDPEAGSVTPTGVMVLSSLDGQGAVGDGDPDTPSAFWTVAGDNLQGVPADLDLDGTPDTSLVDIETARLFAGDEVRLYYTRDQDGDGLYEYVEEALGTDDLTADSDDDGLTDQFEVAEGVMVGEGVPSLALHGYPRLVFLDPLLADSDADGLSDQHELDVTLTDPNHPDTDRDGLRDAEDPQPLHTAGRRYVETGAPGAGGSSWATAGDFGLTLQEVQNLNTDGDATNDVAEIWVRQGSYSPGLDDPVHAYRLPNDVKIYGGFQGDELSVGERNPDPFTNMTVFAGETGSPFTTDDNAASLLRTAPITSVGADSRIVIDGFSFVGIRNGAGATPDDLVTALLVDDDEPEHVGGSHHVTVRNCLFYDNQDAAGGAAVRVTSGPDSSVTLDSCTFLFNGAVQGGAVYRAEHDSNIVIQDCVFRSNEADMRGGALFTVAPDATTEGLQVHRSVFDSNVVTGWSIDLGYYKDLHLHTNNPPPGTLTFPGGGAWAGAAGTLLDCDFYSNRAGKERPFGTPDDVAWGGAILIGPREEWDGLDGQPGLFLENDPAPIVIANCRLWNNEAKAGGGGIVVGKGHNCECPQSPNSTPTIQVTNCTVAGNTTRVELYGHAGFGRIPFAGFFIEEMLNFAANLTHDQTSPGTFSFQNSVFHSNTMKDIHPGATEFANVHLNLQSDLIALGLFELSEVFYVSHTLVGSGWPEGFGNPGVLSADVDDLFMNLEAGDLRLRAGAVGVDAGLNSVDLNYEVPGIQFLPPTDLDGLPRIVDADGNGAAVVDMGAFERPTEGYVGEEP